MKFLALGKRLRSFREKKTLSVKALSSKTGVSPDQLEEFEKDLQVPRIADLIKIAKALEINVADIFRERHFFKADGKKTASQKTYEIIRSSEQLRVSPLTEPTKSSVKDYLYTPLTMPSDDKHLDAYLLDIPPHQVKRKESDLTHPGEEFLYVIEGKIKMMVDGDEFDMETGDSIFIRSQYPHALWNPFDTMARALSVVYPF